MVVEAEVRTRRFYSRAGGLLMERVRPIERETLTGGREVVQEAVRYDFSTFGGPGGRLHVRDGDDLLPTAPGEELEDAAAWLRRQPQFNVLVFEEGNEPDALRPSDAEFLDAVLQAATALDADALRVLLDEERHSHNRDHLIQRVETALAAVGAQETGTV